MNYYDKPALSSTAINNFIIESPARFWAETPLNPDAKKWKETDALILGRATHTLLFEPHLFNSQYWVHNLNRQTKAFKEQKLECGLPDIKQDVFDNIQKMIEAVHNHSIAKNLVNRGEAEQEFFWQRKDMQCKGKTDYIKNGYIVDYKTFDWAGNGKSAIEKWQRAIVSYGYHRQAEFYLDGVQRATGEVMKGFIHILQDKKVPSNIGVMLMDKDSLIIAHEENEAAIYDIKNRLDNNNWFDFDQTQVIQSGLPEWYITNYNGDYNND